MLVVRGGHELASRMSMACTLLKIVPPPHRFSSASRTLTRGLSNENCATGSTETVDVAVIGAGVVGCAVARAAAVSGYTVSVYERRDAVGSAAASSGNSGLGHTGYDAPAGSIEEALLRRSIRLRPALFHSLGLREHHVGTSLTAAGALVVAWSPDEEEALEQVLIANHRAGDTDVAWWDQALLRRNEPALSHKAVAAVHCPHEVVVEPWLLPIAYAHSAMQHGATFYFETAVTDVQSGTDHTTLTIQQAHDECSTTTHRARVVVNCGGLYGDHVEAMRTQDGGDVEPPFTIAPRKGSFLLFDPPRNAVLPQHIIERVPTDRTKGPIVWVNLHGHLVVGPTATDQVSREDRAVTATECAALEEFGRSVCPVVAECTMVGTYAGLRPGTQFRDYQLSIDQQRRWITLGGIRSTGVSASPALAEHACGLIAQLVDKLDPPPLPSLVGISAAAGDPLPLTPTPKYHNQAIPPLPHLKREFQARNDDHLTLWGLEWRVAHPQTLFGFSGL